MAGQADGSSSSAGPGRQAAAAVLHGRAGRRQQQLCRVGQADGRISSAGPGRQAAAAALQGRAGRRQQQLCRAGQAGGSSSSACWPADCSKGRRWLQIEKLSSSATTEHELFQTPRVRQKSSQPVALCPSSWVRNMQLQSHLEATSRI